MSNNKEKTLDEIKDAQEIIENERASDNLNNEEKQELEKAALKLRKLERNIIRLKQQELVDQLTEDSQALKEMIKEMKKASTKLEKVAKTLDKLSGTVASLIDGLKEGINAGII